MRSLYFQTEIDVQAADRVVTERSGYVVVRSPSNPGFHWGNFLLFPEPPGPGDGPRWEQSFDREFAPFPQVRRRVFGWERTDGAIGEAPRELADYELERFVALAAAPQRIARRGPVDGIELGALDPAGDERRWQQVAEVWAATNREGDDGDQPEPADEFREFTQRRLAELRQLFRAGRGSWFVALDGDRVVASLGVVVTAGRARFQQVDTVASHRRRGIASALIGHAVARIAAAHPVERFVIAADPDYHAAGLYLRLGFEECERLCGARERA